MNDPVIAQDGHTYERKAIEEWLQKSKTSPMTREELSADNLVTNRLVREEILDLLQAKKSIPNRQAGPLVLEIQRKSNDQIKESIF